MYLVEWCVTIRMKRLLYVRVNHPHFTSLFDVIKQFIDEREQIVKHFPPPSGMYREWWFQI